MILMPHTTATAEASVLAQRRQEGTAAGHGRNHLGWQPQQLYTCGLRGTCTCGPRCIYTSDSSTGEMPCRSGHAAPYGTDAGPQYPHHTSQTLGWDDAHKTPHYNHGRRD